MADIWMDVDAALAEVPVNLLPLISDSDFKTIDADVNYNVAGLALIWHFVTTAGAYSQTAVTPTDTGGNYDWVEQGNGMFTIEIPASGGATINNDTEGFGWFTGVATGILPWRGPVIGFRRAALNDLLIDGSTASTNMEDFFDGTGYAGGTIKLGVNLIQILGTTLTETAGQIAAAFKKFFDIASPTSTANRITLVDTTTTNTDMRGTDSAGLATELAKVPKSDGAVTWNATALASINAEVVDTLATDTYTEPGQGAPGVNISLAAKINYLYKAWRNRKTQTATLKTIYADDATTADHKSTVADDATTYSETEWTTGA